MGFIVRSSFLALLFSSVVHVAVAVPAHGKIQRNSPSDDDASILRQWQRELVKRVPNAADDPNWAEHLPCDLSNVVMPQAPVPLPPPSPGSVLAHIVVGRGTQNYTCSEDSAEIIPVANGAIATLYNATCVAANFPELLSLMPKVALQFPPPEPDMEKEKRMPANILYSGHHYFTDSTTPIFDLNTEGYPLGVVAAKKLNGTDAPVGAPKGPAGMGAGSVPWLLLGAKDSTSTPWKEIYRLVTAGGMPPKNCAGQPSVMEVPYSAQYWLYR